MCFFLNYTIFDTKQLKMVEGCNECKKKGVSKTQIGTIILGFYILFASIYGTIQLVKHLINLTH